MTDVNSCALGIQVKELELDLTQCHSMPGRKVRNDSTHWIFDFGADRHIDQALCEGCYEKLV